MNSNLVLRWKILLFVFLLFSKAHAYIPDTPIRVIVFDFGGVIANTNLEGVSHYIEESFQISYPEAEKLLSHWYRLNKLSNPGMKFWQNYAHSQGFSLSSEWFDQFNEKWHHAIELIPGMIPLVKELQKKGYQTAMLSNTTPFHAEVVSKLGYYHYFRPLLLSYQIGVSKPDPRAYEILLEKLNRQPYQVLFIDDKEINIIAAKELGIDAIQFSSVDELKKELAKRRIEIDKVTSQVHRQKICN